MKIEDKLFLDRFKVAEESHIKIINADKCRNCQSEACLYFCPANVYRREGDRIVVHYEGCLECGSCRIACEHLNVDWQFPKGGYGIAHKFG